MRRRLLLSATVVCVVGLVVAGANVAVHLLDAVRCASSSSELCRWSREMVRQWALAFVTFNFILVLLRWAHGAELKRRQMDQGRLVPWRIVRDPPPIRPRDRASGKREN